MEKPRVLKELYIGILLVAFFFLVLGIVVMRPFWIFALGLMVGCIGACVWLYAMYDTLDRALDMRERNVKSFAALRSVLRLIAVMAVMIVAIIIHWVAFVGVTVGLLTLKISALFNPLIKRLCDKYLSKKSITAEAEDKALHDENDLAE